MGLLVWLLVIQIHGFDQNGGKGLPAKKVKNGSPVAHLRRKNSDAFFKATGGMYPETV